MGHFANLCRQWTCVAVGDDIYMLYIAVDKAGRRGANGVSSEKWMYKVFDQSSLLLPAPPNAQWVANAEMECR